MIQSKINPWNLPAVAESPPWPFSDIDLWHRGNSLQSINVIETKFPEGVRFHQGNQAHFRLRDAFLCVGILTSPAPISSSAWAFFLQHIRSLRYGPGQLRLTGDCEFWEERTRTHFAECFAVGMAGWLMWKSHNILHIADAGPFLSESISDSSSPYYRKDLRSLGLYGKNGGLKPDFFCLTRDGRCVIAESKGGIGPPSQLTSAKNKGKEQVQNVAPVGVKLRTAGSRLVFASNFRHENENPRRGKESCITVVDPEEGFEPIQVSINPDTLALHSYCKFLSFSGQSNISRMLLRGESIAELVEGARDVIQVGENWILPILTLENYIIGLEIGVARNVFRNEPGLSSRLAEELPFEGIVSTEDSITLPNGVIFAMLD